MCIRGTGSAIEWVGSSHMKGVLVSIIRRTSSVRTTSHALLALLLLPAASALASQWEPAPALPTGGAPREFAVGLNVDGVIYALGGTPWVNGNDRDGSVHALPSGGAWTTAEPLGGMGPIVHQGAGVDVLGRIIVFGGRNIDNGDPGEGKVYDPIEGPTTTIADRSPLAPAENFAWCTDDAGRIYSLGGGPGADASGGNPNSAYCERYDGVTDTWTPIAPLPVPMAAARAVYDGQGHILVLGGINEDASARLITVAHYTIATDAWSLSTVAELPTALSDHAAVLGADGRVYVMGGRAGALPGGMTQAATYVLTPATNTWTPGPALSTPRADFALALGDDDYIYAIGGRNDAGGTDLVERLYTPSCPTFAVPPAATSVWSAQTAQLSASVVGGTPMEFQWRKDGQDLVDGPKSSGGSISGAQTMTLTLTQVNENDGGAYTLLATNACGPAESPAAVLTVRLPPAIPQQWMVTNLHPGWALRSEARDIDGETQVGIAGLDVAQYTNLDQPVLWMGTSASAQNLTPAGSVGGAITAASGGRQVGWWWWPYQCRVGGQWQTCYSRQACEWFGSAASHVNKQVSGYEYSAITDTDGEMHVGSASYDDPSGNYYTRAIIWNAPGFHGISIHPSGASSSYLYAVADGRQFGAINTPYPGPKPHAAMWSGGAATFIDLHPSGAVYSTILGAGDDQAVGTTGLNVDSRAVLWSYATGTETELHPAGASVSGARRCQGGVQVGYASFAGAGHAALWTGTAESHVDLHDYAPPEFTSTTAYGLEIARDGTITIAGAGYNSATGRTEALMWRSAAAGLTGDLNCDGVIDNEDIDPFVLALTGGPATYQAAWPNCNYQHADINGDGLVDNEDIDPFVALLTRP